MIVETDAGGDPDDEQSLVRFLMYANEWDIEGIIANRPVAREGENTHVERTGIGIVRSLLHAYGECYPQLVQHDPRYPTMEALLERTVAGGVGTAAAELVLAALESEDPRPVWFLNWGTDYGSNPSALKLALDQVHAQRGAAEYARLKSRLRLSSDDRFGEHTWEVPPAFPLWVDTFRPERDGGRWYHRFSALTATAGGFDIERDVRTGHGPLGAMYPVNTDRPQKEGDSMTFLYLVPTGMNHPEHPEWGSWGGRYGQREEKGVGRPYYWANVADAWEGTVKRDHVLARWAVALQNDFKARLDWCVAPFEQANHPPQVKVAGEAIRHAKAGERIELDATATKDPDGDALSFDWLVYPEAGSYEGPAVELHSSEPARMAFTMPDLDEARELHVVLAVTDAGEPALTRYARIIVRAPQADH